MGYGIVTTAVLDTIDAVAPGSAGLSVMQTSNSRAEVTITLPTMDADGSPLTGLTYVEGVALVGGAEAADFIRDDFEGAKAADGAIVFQMPVGDEDITLTTEIPIVPGKSYVLGVRCADHAFPVPA